MLKNGNLVGYQESRQYPKMRGVCMHNDFTLLLRTYPNGKKVWFYYAYDEEGRRRGAWTTKNKSKTEARNYCNKLLKKGALIPDRTKILTFGEFANGYWDRESEYVQYRNSRTDITQSYISGCKCITQNQIIPYFGDVPLDKITTEGVNKWLLGFSKREVIEDGEKKQKKYKNSYANTALKAFRVMMGEAVRRGHIKTNPCTAVPYLKDDHRDIEIFTVDEVRRLFPENYQTVWGKKDIAFAANKLASLNGMRSGEILGLKGECVFDNYILVCGQFGRFGYLPHTKTKQNRNIPLVPEMIDLLRKLMERNGNGFLFSVNGGATPICHTVLSYGLNEAMQKIGISKEEIRRRRLSLHGWRHFVNTELQRQGFTVPQVQSITGHLTNSMTERYSHLDARQIDNIVEAQALIAGTGKPDDGKPDGDFKGLTLVKTNRKADTNSKGA
jgi:integrase